MPTSTPLQPTITEAGLAAIFNAQSTGVEFALSHIAFGTAQYNPDGTETALQTEMIRVPIAGGGPISPTQIQIYAIAQAAAGSPFFVGEIGFFGDDGQTLLAVYSSTATPSLYLSDTVSTSVSYALGLAALPAGSVTVTIDPSASAALLLIGQHVAAPDPHPQYVEKANGVAFYDPTLTFILDAQIIGDDGLVYQSIQANNIGHQPSSSPTWWVPLFNYGDTLVAGLTNVDVTLTSTQAARAYLTLSGALTAPVNIIFPTWLKEWTVVNNTTGGFAVTCKTAAGTGVPVDQGFPSKVYGDGTNILSARSDFNNIELTGIPTVPTAPPSTNTTQAASTAFANAAATAAAAGAAKTPLSTTVPPVDSGSGAVGASANAARADHVHPTDSTRLAKSGDTMTGNLQTLTQSETATAPAITAGALTLNLALSNVFQVAMSANITTLTLENPPTAGIAFSFTAVLTASGTAYSVTWPSSVLWPSGSAPTLTSTAGKKDRFVFETTDGGVTYRASPAGQNF